ncbi:MAG TPA: rhodanese-like domain-containing protein [Stellaceae bacterium]|nr:rhodanese-like domain-containing protein [Stellaceae bacterium]
MFAALTRLFRKSPAGNSPGPVWVDVADLRARLAGEEPLVLDVRGPDEFAGPLGHIEGALNIPLAELAARHAELAGAGRPIVCVCLTDKRSATAATQLAAAGVGEVSVLRGGMKAWREAGIFRDLK